MEQLDAYNLSKKLIAEHGLVGWTFRFDNAVRRFGACHYGLRQITLSKKLTELNSEAEVKNVILHEIAHAKAGQRCGHNWEWKMVAKSIGCTGDRCYGAEVTKPAANYIGTCQNCNRKIERYKRKGIACGECCNKYNNGMFSDEYKFIWNSMEETK